MGKLIALLFILSLLSTGCRYSETGPVARPNIILIVADDMGYGDAGCYGNTNVVPTPNIDRLAKEGVRFTDGYVTAPLCAPARYGMLTGVYQQKFGVRWNMDAALDLSQYGIVETPEETRIPKPIEIISEPLERAGYSTVILGKWNLPMYPKTTFDETLSVMHFVGEYFPDENGHYKGVDGVKSEHEKSGPVWGPLERETDEYLTDRLGIQATDYINQHKEDPFFMYLAFNTPHTPLQAKKEDLKRVEHLPSEALKLYGAMLISMDENIGRVLDALDENGLTDNTLVAFMSDNGATFAYPMNWPQDWEKEILGSNGNLRGYKAGMYEGGIRVPFILRYPDQLKAGQVYREPVTSLDLYPTFCALAGAQPNHQERLDGVNLIPYLKGTITGLPHDILYWHMQNKGAVRQGQYKYYVQAEKGELYNLEKDISESEDLSTAEPGKMRELEERYLSFVNSLPPPLNPNRNDKFNSRQKRSDQ